MENYTTQILPPSCSYIHKLRSCPKQEDGLKTHEGKCSTLYLPIPSSCPVFALLTVGLQTTQLESQC